MFNYVAATWNSHSEAQQSAARLIRERMEQDAARWSVAYAAPGVIVYCTGVRPRSIEVHSLHAQRGVVLGTVFERIGAGDGTPPKARFGVEQTRRVVDTLGRALAQDYWGRYVAFVALPDESSVLVMRSPIGEIDCLTTELMGVRIYFSDSAACPPLELGRFSINWDYVAADLATLLPDTKETGLNEIERVRCGECIRTRVGRFERLCHWHPFSFVNGERIEDPIAAARELRRVARACVDAWASCYGGIIAMLSGGLDSSIVVGLLPHARSRPRVVCLNYRNAHDPNSDERSYARLVAQRAGYPLTEAELSPKFPLELILQMPKVASPWLHVYGIGEVAERAELARRHDAQAWFLGHGGDEIFFQLAGEFNVADFTYRYGLRPRVFSIAMDAARMTRRAVWPTLIEGVRDGLRRSGLEPTLRTYDQLFPLLRSEVLESIRARRLFIPHWFDAGDRIPAGKCSQILSFSVPPPLYSNYAQHDEPEAVSPLASQPMQELSLRIPTHVLALGGKGRGLARKAFAQDLPPQIVRRHTKGTVQDFLKVFWISHRSRICALLLDGQLVRQGVVDRVKLERTMTDSFEGDFTHIPRLASLVCAEAWAQNWRTDGMRRAA